jgi:hypothetical protein
MPALSTRRHAAALLAYVSIAVLFSWPLPRYFNSALLGTPLADTGVYVWNLWVFRHEVVEHGRFPFFTFEILTAVPSVPLTLHNYTTVANLIAFPLLPLLGTVATFNLLTVASPILSAYLMFLFLRQRVADNAAAWIGGLLFGFSPFMMARQMAHFSLVQTAALPAFAHVLYQFRSDGPTRRRAVAGGAIVAWAYLSDPYFAVYCVLMACFFVAWEAMTFERRDGQAPLTLRVGLDIALTVMIGLVTAIVLRGGGRFELWGLRVSMTGLYTPMLLLTILAAARVWVALKPRIGWRIQPLRRFIGAGAVAVVTCLVLLSPVLSAMGGSIGHDRFIWPRILWRSSAAGVDLLAYLVPNPVSRLFGWVASGWLNGMPDGFHDNVAAIPWTATFTVAIALLYAGLRLPAYWVTFTSAAAVLALGPFVHIAGINTHVPTPWVLLRYLPVVGAARMPMRLSILVTLGVAVLMAFAVRALRARSQRPALTAAVVGGLLVVELMPAPREMHHISVPSFYARVAADPRDVRVLHLPFGVRDGLSSTGDYSASAQFLQTFHEKPLVGGMLSRLPPGGVNRYRRIRLYRVMMDLSEGRPVSAERMEAVIEETHLQRRGRLQIGYVVVDTTRTSPQLVEFARSALDLRWVATEQGQALYIVQ